MLGQLRKGCGKVVYSWKSSELKSAKPCEENGKNLALNPIQYSRNSQSCVCSIGCSANWGRAVGRSYIRERALNLNRLSSVREKAKSHPQPNSIIRAIPSYMCVQLDG